jgi:hypothetical protein
VWQVEEFLPILASREAKSEVCSTYSCRIFPWKKNIHQAKNSGQHSLMKIHVSSLSVR